MVVGYTEGRDKRDIERDTRCHGRKPQLLPIGGRMPTAERIAPLLDSRRIDDKILSLTGSRASRGGKTRQRDSFVRYFVW